MADSMILPMKFRDINPGVIKKGDLVKVKRKEKKRERQIYKKITRKTRIKTS